MPHRLLNTFDQGFALLPIIELELDFVALFCSVNRLAEMGGNREKTLLKIGR